MCQSKCRLEIYSLQRVIKDLSESLSVLMSYSLESIELNQKTFQKKYNFDYKHHKLLELFMHLFKKNEHNFIDNKTTNRSN